MNINDNELFEIKKIDEREVYRWALLSRKKQSAFWEMYRLPVFWCLLTKRLNPARQRTASRFYQFQFLTIEQVLVETTDSSGIRTGK
jgi:hypothetical protein